jgi:TamB, inner membrane protein subunit of TAM complex
MASRQRRLWMILAILATLAGAAAAWRAQLAVAAVRGIAAAAGFRLSFSSLRLTPGELTARDVAVDDRSGEPIARIGTFDLRYSIRDLLPGSAHAYGLTGFDVERAAVIVIRHKDGTFNVPIPRFNGASGTTARYAFHVRLRDVAVTIDDRAQGVPSARHLAIDPIDGDFDVDTAARSHYRVTLSYVEGGRRFPVYGSGDVDARHGVGVQRWQTAELPVGRIVDAALDSPSFHVIGGFLHDLDVRIVDLPDVRGAPKRHASATATLEGARIAIGGLAKPLRNVSGPIAAYGDGFLLQGVAATIAGVPIRLAGGVYGLAAPSFDLTAAGTGDLRQLRAVLNQSHGVPLAGTVGVGIRVEGPVTKPLTLIALNAPHAAYASVPFDATSVLAAFDGQEFDLVDARTTYAGATLRARGRLNLRPQPRALEILATVDVPSGALPYASAAIPGMPLHATMAATGDRPGAALVHGVLTGANRTSKLTGEFALGSNGIGRLGPLRITGPNESLYAIAAMRRHDVDGYVDARNLLVDDRQMPSLPGFDLPKLPPMDGRLDATVRAGIHSGTLRATGAARVRDVRVGGTGIAHANVRFGATSAFPLVAVFNAAGIGTRGARATATIAYARNTVVVHDAAAAAPGTFADARGRITGIARGTPQYDLDAALTSADVASLAAYLHAPRQVPLEGELEARVHVGGAGTAPTVAGSVAVPEGAVNGLAFHDLATEVSASPAGIALRAGTVTVGSSEIAFAGTAAGASERLSVAASRVDLEDFDDYFDSGDVLRGNGSVRAAVTVAGARVVASSGAAEVHSAAFRGFELGSVRARWNGTAARFATALTFGGPFGTVAAAGTVGLNGSVAMTARARGVDLAQWLPMAGLRAPTVTGTAQADARVAGRYPDLDANLALQVAHGSVGRVPVRHFSIAADLRDGRGRIQRASALIPNARIGGGGTFGLHRSDPLHLVFDTATGDVAALGQTLTGKRLDAAGALRTTLRIGGTAARPVVTADFTLSHARYGRFAVPRATGRFRIEDRTAALDGGTVDLATGRVLASASLPIQFAPLAIDPHRPARGRLVADDVEASNVSPLLPQGTQIAGRVDGSVDLNGTPADPRLHGELSVANGAFSGPQETLPITGAAAHLRFEGQTVRLTGATARAGGGTLGASGAASVPSIGHWRDATLALNIRAAGARIDAPSYFKGRIDADVKVVRAAGAPPRVSGSVALSSARIPLTALYNPKSANASAPNLPDAAFDLTVAANRDVRVVSSNVDVGATGSVRVLGTTASPRLRGSFDSTGGTVSFLRDFRVRRGTVAFDPADGAIPTVDAVATTYIGDPSTDVRLHVTGPATALHLGLVSNPPYDREQILGLLVNAQSVGAVRGVTARGTPVSAMAEAGQLAGDRLDRVFTRNLLEPLSLALGSSLGLQNLQIASDVQNGLGIDAVKAFGNYVNFVFAESFNEERRTSWSLQSRPSSTTRLDLTAYTAQDVNAFVLQPPPAQNQPVAATATIPRDSGTNGVNVEFRSTFP